MMGAAKQRRIFEAKRAYELRPHSRLWAACQLSRRSLPVVLGVWAVAVGGVVALVWAVFK